MVKKPLIDKGFSLLELLIAMAIMGLVIVAVYSLYLNTQRTANTSDEVVEVQQNLRVAIDQMARVHSNGRGFWCQRETNPITSAPASLSSVDKLTIETSTSGGKVARIVTDFTSPADPSTEEDITVSSADMVDLFESGTSGGDYVRIIRPADDDSPMDRVFLVTSKSRSAKRLTLKGFNAAQQFVKGDLIVWVGTSIPTPIVTLTTDQALSRDLRSHIFP